MISSNDSEVTVSDVTSHVSPLVKLNLSYEFDECGPKVVVRCRMYIATYVHICTYVV